MISLLDDILGRGMIFSVYRQRGDDSPELLRYIIMSFILAGRDTTSSALSWFFWLLSLHPEVEHKILQEMKSIRERTRKRIGESL
ncbi:unnamed protein product [Arabis nemorensis]|uniref:Cytochrome P450 n=1 Tax=Arabis nemorensis TaxID=586526 RepID=A0A565BX25_9BRAS|nr:unnamed protein product [Arabis nemorensis]